MLEWVIGGLLGIAAAVADYFIQKHRRTATKLYPERIKRPEIWRDGLLPMMVHPNGGTFIPLRWKDWDGETHGVILETWSKPPPQEYHSYWFHYATSPFAKARGVRVVIKF